MGSRCDEVTVIFGQESNQKGLGAIIIFSQTLWVLHQSTAGFIEDNLSGLRPDIALLNSGMTGNDNENRSLDLEVLLERE